MGDEEERESIVLRGTWKVFVARSWAGSESDAIPSFFLFFPFFFPSFSRSAPRAGCDSSGNGASPHYYRMGIEKWG